MSVFARLLDLIFPPRCAGCRQRGVAFCQRCVARCRPLASAPPPPSPGLASARGVYVFEPPLRQAVHDLKYRGLGSLATPLAGLMADHLRTDVDLAGRQLAVAWVPMHARRQRQRGYNQAELLARALARALGLPLAPGLARARLTTSQVGMSAAQRRANLADAVAWAAPAPPPGHVLLVDDVLTTGATLAACAAALRAAGAREVHGRALAQSLATPALRTPGRETA